MIQIELLRVSPDSKYIEFIVDCPAGYHFNRLEIKRYDYQTDPEDPQDKGWIDCISVLEGNITREVVRLATSIFGASTMFHCLFGIVADNYVEGVSPEPETITGVCSNINDFYFCAHDMIQALEMQKIPREEFELLCRWYFAFYAHVEAVRLERYDDAERYYDILKEIIIEAGYKKREFETRNFTV